MISLAKHTLRFYLIAALASGAITIGTLEAFGKNAASHLSPQALKNNLDPQNIADQIGSGIASIMSAITTSIVPEQSQEAKVIRVIDGDTIRVKAQGKKTTIRLIGVDTPETKKPNHPVECFGKAATKETTRLLEGKTVLLTFDVERQDKYGRTLAYVERRGKDIGARLLRGGYARTLSIEPNTKRKAQYESIQRKARHMVAGLWETCN